MFKSKTIKGSKSRETPLQDFLAPWFAVFVQQCFPANKNHQLSFVWRHIKGEEQCN